jgi:hypothetical protein
MDEGAVNALMSGAEPIHSPLSSTENMEVLRFGRSSSATDGEGRCGVDQEVFFISGYRHEVTGHRSLRHHDVDLSGVPPICDEWWDGGGYPPGLRGVEIPEEARIADVFSEKDLLP